MTFKRHRISQIDVERFVSHAHCTSTQLDRFPVFALQQLIMLKALRWRDGILRRTLTGFNPTSKSLAKHADRTE